MPQTTPERAARWPGMDQEAMQYLVQRGFECTGDFYWMPPTPEHKLTEKENDAVLYLIEEWDFGGVLRQ